MITHRLTRLAFALAATGTLAACGIPQRIAQEGGQITDQASQVRSGIRQDPLLVDAATPGSTAFVDRRANEARNAPVSRRASRAWIGARMADVQSDEVLPPIFMENFKFNFDDANGRVKIGVVAERISRLTNVPVRVKQDVYQGPSGANGPTGNMAQQGMAFSPSTGAVVPPLMPNLPGAKKTPAGLPDLPAAGTPLAAPPGVFLTPTPYREFVTDIDSIEMRHDGTLASFLDQVTGRLNLSWAYRDGVVVIERFVSESFELATFVGSQDFKMSLSGQNNGQSSSSAGGGGGNNGSTTTSLDLTETGKIAALDSLRKSIENMVKPSGGDVTLSEGTGRFTVTATKDVMGRVREILKHESEAMQRQAHIQIDVYSVTANDGDERGVNWNIVYQSLSKSWGAVVSSPATLASSLSGNIGYSILRPEDGGNGDSARRFGDSSAVLNLLNTASNTAQFRPFSMIAMNRQWARKANLKTDGYLSETTPATASSVGSGAPGLKTSSIVTGDKFLVQPAILDNGAILLKFGVSLTELLSLFDVSAGSGQTFQKVQTPVTSGTDDQTTIRLMPGEAMVVTGLSRRTASGDARTLADGLSIGLGGSRKVGYKREDFMIVVRAVQM